MNNFGDKRNTKPPTREAQEKGRKALQEKRERMKTIKEDLTILLNLALSEGRAVSAEELKSLAEANGKNVSVQTAIDVAIVQRAMMGDVQAAIYIRDTIGQKPSDKVELDSNLTVEAWAKKHSVRL